MRDWCCVMCLALMTAQMVIRGEGPQHSSTRGPLLHTIPDCPLARCCTSSIMLVPSLS